MVLDKGFRLNYRTNSLEASNCHWN